MQTSIVRGGPATPKSTHFGAENPNRPRSVSRLTLLQADAGSQHGNMKVMAQLCAVKGFDRRKV